MENAVGALKIAFSVFVFTIALSLAVSVVGQARATSDVIFHYNDKTEFYDYITPDNGENAEDRIVGFETIIPTIHRYAKEQFAVTIYDNRGNPIVRYDLWTEGFTSNWQQIVKNKDNIEKVSYDYIIERFLNLQNIVNRTLNISQNEIDEEEIIAIIANLYEVESSQNESLKVGAPWLGDNDKILERIRCDMLGTEFSYNDITYKGKNLEQYKDKQFIEKFIEISTSGETITDEDVSLETIKGNSKLEIIYIMK